MNNVWGLDFGTTTTYLSKSQVIGSTNFPLREQGSTTPFIPSIVRIGEGGVLLAGNSADSPDEDNIVRSVKRAITQRKTKEPLPVENQPQGQPQILYEDAIRSLLIRVRELLGDDLGDSAIRLGCPAMWDASQRQELLDLAREAGFTVQYDTLIDEPVAASMAWYEGERLKNRSPQGRVLVFDMGGGTLDVAVMNIVEAGHTPEIYVLASDGLSEAGDVLDASIGEVLLQAAEGDAELHSELRSRPGMLRRLARKLKEEMGQGISSSTNFVTRQRKVVELELGIDDLKRAFEPQFERALHLVHKTLRMAELTNWNRVNVDSFELAPMAYSAHQVRNLEITDLIRKIDYVVLVGGMSRLQLLQDMLIQNGFAADKIYSHESLHPDQAVSLGLAVDKDYEHLNLDRPGFNFEIQWLNRQGEKCREVIYKAYDRLYPTYAGAKLLEHFWRNRHLTPASAEAEFGVFVATTTSGVRLSIEFEGVERFGQGLKFVFGDLSHNRPQYISIQPNGRMVLSDAYSKVVFKIDKWPVIRGNSGKLNVSQTSSSEDGTTGLPWHLLPYD